MVVSPQLRDLVKDTAKRLNRKAEDADPYLSLLENNWYDTVDSLKAVQVAELQALGIPQRFAKELLQLAQTDDKRPEQPSHPPPAPPAAPALPKGPPPGPPPRKRKRDPDVHEDGGWSDGKEKGQWKASKGSQSWEESNRGSSDKGNCKAKGRDKGGKGDRHDDRSADRPNSGRDDHRGNQWWEEDWHKGQRGADHRQWDHKDEPRQWDHKDEPVERYHEEERPDKVSHKNFPLTHKITFADELDPKFPLGARLIGKGGQNVKHITKTTGAWVWLCGRGSGFKEDNGRESDEPLHVLVKSHDQASLDNAVSQTNDLLDTVLQMYSEWMETGKLPGDEQNRPCYECGELGHIAKFCSKRDGSEKGRSHKGHSKGHGWERRGERRW